MVKGRRTKKYNGAVNLPDFSKITKLIADILVITYTKANVQFSFKVPKVLIYLPTERRNINIIWFKFLL